MSLARRLIIAAIAFLCGVIMLMAAFVTPTRDRLLFGGLGSFFLVVTLECFLKGRPARFVGSLIAMGVLCFSGTVLTGVVKDAWSKGLERGMPQATMLLLGLCGSAILYLIVARFGFGPEPATQSAGKLEEAEQSVALDEQKDALQ